MKTIHWNTIRKPSKTTQFFIFKGSSPKPLDLHCGYSFSANALKLIGGPLAGYPTQAHAHRACRLVKLRVKLHVKNITHTEPYFFGGFPPMNLHCRYNYSSNIPKSIGGTQWATPSKPLLHARHKHITCENQSNFGSSFTQRIQHVSNILPLFFSLNIGRTKNSTSTIQ